VIPAGLGVLALEFAWARLWLRKLKAKGKSVMDRVMSSSSKKSSENSK
jgi:hypothetical protein